MNLTDHVLNRATINVVVAAFVVAGLTVRATPVLAEDGLPTVSAAEQALKAERFRMLSAVRAQAVMQQRPGLEAAVAALPADVRDRPLVPCTTVDDRVLSGRSYTENRRWKSNTVAYRFNANVTPAEQAVAVAALNSLEQFTDMDFVAWTNQDDWIEFTDNEFNNSNVGPNGGQNTINIFNWNEPGVIIHEVMHSLGWSHTQARVDRDSHVRINWGNINDDPDRCVAWNNFRIKSTATDLFDYDFGSIMHYGERDFSACRQSVVGYAACVVGITALNFWVGLAAAEDICDYLVPYTSYQGDPFLCSNVAANVPGAVPTPSCPDDGRTVVTLDASKQHLIGNRSFVSVGDIVELIARYGSTSGLTFAPPNTSPATALPIACGGIQIASMYGTPVSEFPGEPAELNHTVWYTTVGNGDTYLARGTGVNQGVVVRVLNNARTAVIASSASNTIPETSWNTSPGTTYYIALSTPWALRSPFLPSNARQDASLSLLCAAANNNLCSQAIPLNPNSPNDALSNVAVATNDGSATCGGPNGDVWYFFVAPTNGRLEVWTRGRTDTGGNPITPDTVLSLHTACPGTTSNQILCADSTTPGVGDGLVIDASLAYDMTAGQLVYVRVSHETGLARNGDITLITRFFAENDSCAGAVSLENGVAASADLRYLNFFGRNEGTCLTGFSGNHAAWYRFDIPGPGTLVVDTVNTAEINPDADPKLVLFAGPCSIALAGADNVIGCNDDRDGTTENAEIVYQATGPQTVFIRMTQSGFYTQANSVSSTALVRATFTQTAPDNDLCSDAIAVSAGQSIAGTLRAASLDGGQSCRADSATVPDVWYSFTATRPGILTADTFGTYAAGGADTILSIHDRCPGGAFTTQLDCNDDAIGLDSRVMTPVVPGVPVFIRVSHWVNDPRDFTFTLNIDFVQNDPSPLSVVRDGEDPTIEQSLDFIANYNTPVVGVDTADFVPVQTGDVDGATITNVRPYSTAVSFTNVTGRRAVSAVRPVLNLTPGFTIESWVRIDALSASFTNNIFSTNDARNRGVRFGVLGDGRLEFTTYGIQNYITVNTYVPRDVWTHVAVVFDTGGEANFYVNGQFVETVNGNASIINNPSAAALIGGDSIGSMTGAVDELRVWNIQRTPQQIADGVFNRPFGNEPGLIGYWPMDRLLDLGVGNAGENDLIDVSSTAAHADLLSPTPAAVVQGRPSAPGLRYDRQLSGSSVTVPTIPAYNMPNTFTVEGRIRLDSNSQGSPFGGENNGSQGGFRFFRTPGGGLLATVVGVQDISWAPAGTNWAPIGQWVHIAATVDAGRVMRIYLNGQQSGGTFTLSQNVRPYGPNFYIGRGNSGAEWDGAVDEVRLWNVVRTQSQINADKNRTLSGTEPGLVGLWSADTLEDLGSGAPGRNDVRDLSPNANHGEAGPGVREDPAQSYRVTVDRGTGSGQLGIAFVNNGSVSDDLGNALVSVLPAVAEVYTITEPAAPCPCDRDGDEQQTVGDYFAYLTEFFDQLGGPGTGDLDGDGTVTVSDFFEFLNCLPAIAASQACP